jgi:hypothetical protein
MSEGSSTIYVSLVHLSGLNLTYFVDVVGVNTITPFLGSRLDSLLHDLLDLLLALLAVDIRNSNPGRKKACLSCDSISYAR